MTRRITLVILISVIYCSQVTGQSTESANSNLPSIVARLKSSRRIDRSKAFQIARDQLASKDLKAADAVMLKGGLIQLLEDENAATERPSNESEAEEYTDYRSSLIDVVAHMNDERAIPALLGVANSGGMAIRGVARFGRKALLPTLNQATSKDPGLAEGALFVIQKLLEWHSVDDPSAHLQVKEVLHASLKSPSFLVRGAAIYAIEYLDDRDEFVPALKEISEHDPFKLEGQPKEDGTIGDLYTVRNDAKKLLYKIANQLLPATDTGVND